MANVHNLIMKLLEENKYLQEDGEGFFQYSEYDFNEAFRQYDRMVKSTV